jgi:hypothetical protein
MKNMHAKFPWDLKYDYWSIDEPMDDQGSIDLPPAPLSFLVKVFGTCPGAPWFNNAILINSNVSSVLPRCLEHEFDFARYRYRLMLYGDGKSRLHRKNVAFGLTAYEGQSFEFQKLALIDAKKLRHLEKLYDETRVDEDFRPISRLLDDDWIEEYMVPIGMPRSVFESDALIYFDAWFGV